MVRHFFVAKCVCALAPALTQASISAANDTCSEIKNSTERLRCYDDQNGVVKSNSLSIGNWLVNEDTSPVDDSKSVYISIESDQRHVGRFGRGEKLGLMLRCKENVTSAYITFAGEFMASGYRDSIDLTYRIDSRPAQTVGIRESSDNQAAGFWQGRHAIPFINELIGAERLYVRASPWNESPVEGTFTISGLETHLPKLREACNW